MKKLIRIIFSLLFAVVFIATCVFGVLGIGLGAISAVLGATFGIVGSVLGIVFRIIFSPLVAIVFTVWFVLKVARKNATR